MPTIARFSGMSILMFFDDHPPPHIHVSFGGRDALVAIETGLVEAGMMPAKQRRIIRDWVFENQKELQQNWVRANSDLALHKIGGETGGH
jgi:hypothetical protein